MPKETTFSGKRVERVSARAKEEQAMEEEREEEHKKKERRKKMLSALARSHNGSSETLQSKTCLRDWLQCVQFEDEDTTYPSDRSRFSLSRSADTLDAVCFVLSGFWINANSFLIVSKVCN